MEHRHPEDAPAHNAENRDQIDQTLSGSQFRLLRLAARFEDLMEDLDLPTTTGRSKLRFQGTGGVRVLLARTTRLAPEEASHEPQIGAGLLLAELPQRLPAVSSPDEKQVGCKGFPETVTWRSARATTVPSDKSATHVAQNMLLG